MTRHPLGHSSRLRAATLLLGLLSLAPAALAHSPHDVVEQMAVTRGANGEDVIFMAVQLTSRSLFARSFDNGASWTLTAWPLNERDITAIQFSPDYANDDTVLISTSDQGLLLSHDRGDSFIRLNSGGIDLRVQDCGFSADYASDATLWAGTQVGMYVSTDDGASWAAMNNGLTETIITELELAPEDGQTAFAGRRNLYRTTNGGASWTLVHAFSKDMTSLKISPNYAQDQTLVASLKTGGGIFYSQNAGASWSPMVAGLTDTAVNELALGADGSVFAVTETAGCFQAPLGGTFTLTDKGFELLSDLTTNHFRVLALSPLWPADPVVWVGAFEGLFHSDTGGVDFHQRDVYSQKYNRQVVFPPDWAVDPRLYLLNYGGGLLVSPVLPKSNSATPGPVGSGSGGGPPLSGPGSTPNASSASLHGGKVAPPQGYDSRSQGVTSLFGQCLVLSPQFANDNTLYYAQGTFWRSFDRGLSWSALAKPAGVSVIRALAISPAFPADPTLWLGAGAESTVFRSVNSGVTWTQASAGLPASPQTVDIIPSPTYASDQTVFLASKSGGPYRSVNGGLNWSKVATGLPADDLESMALSPGWPSHPVLFAGFGVAGLYRSQDGAASWQPANLGLPSGLPAGIPLSVESIALSPQFDTDGTAFIAVLAAGVFVTHDGGDSWQPVGPGLPQDAPRVVSVSPQFDQDGVVVVSTFGWTYRSKDGGNSFKRLPGYMRYDDFNFQHRYELASSDNMVLLPPPRPARDPLLAAWLLDGACPGDTQSPQVYAALGVSWPFSAWAPGSHGLGVALGNVPGDRLEIDLNGDKIRWFAPLAPDQGKALISVDGKAVALVDLYAPEAGPALPVWEHDFGAVGFHRIGISVTGLANPMSSGVIVRTDGFDLTY